MIVGIDLAGSEKRPTGFCALNGMSSECCVLYTDKEIIENVERIKPKIVAIDAPLALPKGRKSLEERCDIHLRKCDRQLLDMKIKVFPITLGPMRMLTKRGIKLRRILERKGFKVIEVYPGAAQDIWKIPRKQEGLEKLRRGLMKLGVKGDIDKKRHYRRRAGCNNFCSYWKSILAWKAHGNRRPRRNFNDFAKALNFSKTNFTCGKKKACTDTFSLERKP